MVKVGEILNILARYKRLKLEVYPFASGQVKRATKSQMKRLRDELWSAVVDFGYHKEEIVFFNTSQVIDLITILEDTGKIFALDWKRRSTSKSEPDKVAGSIDRITIKKVKGYVKGTSGGEKAMQDVINDRMTVWVCDGYLHTDRKGENPGYSNWRTIYAVDIKGIHLNGVTANLKIA